MSKKETQDAKALQKENLRLRQATEAFEKEKAKLLRQIADQRLESEVLSVVLEEREKEVEILRRPDALLNPLRGLETLIMAYKCSRYTVEGLDKPIRLGQRNPEIDAWIDADDCISRNILPRGWALLSAHNTMSKKLKPAENHRRHQQLIAHLEFCTCHPAHGEDIDTGAKKDSLLVLGINLDNAKFYARLFAQQVLLHADYGQPAKLYMRAEEGLPFYVV